MQDYKTHIIKWSQGNISVTEISVNLGQKMKLI